MLSTLRSWGEHLLPRGSSTKLSSMHAYSWNVLDSLWRPMHLAFAWRGDRTSGHTGATRSSKMMRIPNSFPLPMEYWIARYSYEQANDRSCCTSCGTDPLLDPSLHSLPPVLHQNQAPIPSPFQSISFPAVSVLSFHIFSKLSALATANFLSCHPQSHLINLTVY